MIPIYDSAAMPLSQILYRGEEEKNAEVEAATAEILRRVRMEGDAALYDYTERFDHVRLDSLRVSEEEIEAAFAAADAALLATMRQAAENIRRFHALQLRQEQRLELEDGIILGQRFTPLERVGLYVPGGTAAYPSSVLMSAIPAALAGCPEILMVSPPRPDGSIHPDILTAAKIAGVTAIFKLGGAQAVAALAYGTESVPKADKIVGPGNIFVATAKRQVFGLVDIDMIAGPSEILIVADSHANPAHVAADMLSQAEHDRMATAVLICLDRAMAEAVQAELERQLPLLKRVAIARASIENQGKIIIANDLAAAIKIANAIAPEHLELCLADPFAYLPLVQNAGSIFLGNHSPEPLGDYWAGPNHVLPTAGTARFSGPLSVDDFVKRSSYLYYTPLALEKAAADVIRFAEHEGLGAHANSVAIRIRKDNEN